MKARFFTEFEFQNDLGRTYWLPLTIEALEADGARDLWLRFKTAIETQYTLHRAPEPRLIVEGLNSQYLDEYRSAHARGRVVALYIREWRFREIDTCPELSFDEHINLAVLESGIDLGQTIAKGIERKIPCRVVSEGPSSIHDELLIIDLVVAQPGREGAGINKK
jgi:hypothetical protein